MVPVLAARWENQSELESLYLRALTAVGITVFPGMLFVSVSSDALVTVALGQGWAEMPPILAPLAAAGALQSIFWNRWLALSSCW